MTVGFVGLGNIGKPMALRLASGGDLVVHDVAPEPVTELVAAGATAAPSVAELAGQVDVLCVMVRDDDQVRDVLGEILGVGGDGQTVVIHSTVAPDTPGQLEDTARRHGIKVVDAPVSGGAMGAGSGQLALMVGGTDEAVALIREPFAPMASLVAHLGPIGAGTRAKLARNLITFASYVAVGEAMALAEAAGVDLLRLGDVVRHSDAVTGGPGTIMLRDTAGPMGPADGLREPFLHARGLGEKDLQLALGLGADLGIDLPVARLALDRLGAALGVPHDDAPT